MTEIANTPSSANENAAERADATFVEVETSYGRLRGQDIKGIKVWKSIPYGASTAGKNRFMPPRKPAAWTGVRDALQYGHTAPQPTAVTGEYGLLIGWGSAARKVCAERRHFAEWGCYGNLPEPNCRLRASYEHGLAALKGWCSTPAASSSCASQVGCRVDRDFDALTSHRLTLFS